MVSASPALYRPSSFVDCCHRESQNLHPVDGFLVKNAAVPFIVLAGQKADVGIVTNGMLRRVEHPGKLF